ncbi:MAG: hypothetical protein WKG00_32160 [Polyangiaceae bacterium]
MPRRFAKPLTDEDLRELRQMLADLDPDLAAAADDADRSLIAIALKQSPLERAESSRQMLATLMGFERD